MAASMEIVPAVCRKIKAILFIAMLAGAEMRQVQQGAQFPYGAKQAKGAERAARDINLQIAEPNFQVHSRHIAGQMEAMLADPNILDQAKRIAEQMEVLMAVPSLQARMSLIAGEADARKMEPAKVLAESIEAVQADPRFQEQVKKISEQIKMMLVDENFQKQGKHIAEQIEAMMADPGLQEQAKTFRERIEKMMSTSNMVDKMVGNVVGQIFETPSLDQAGFEDTTLGKVSLNQLQSRPTIRLPGAMDAFSGSTVRKPVGRANAFFKKDFIEKKEAKVEDKFNFANFFNSNAIEQSKSSTVEDGEIDLEALEKEINEVVLLFARLAIASVMIHHGYEKYFSAEMFTKYAIDKYFNFLPGPHIWWTYSVGGVQFFAPFLLGLGVFSRAASASLAGVMAGAVFQSVLSTGLEGFPLSKMASKVPIFHNYGFELPIVYVSVFLLFAATGPGKYSVSQAVGWNDDKSLLGKIKQ